MTNGSDHPLMVTLSGIRGIANESFTPPVIRKFVAGFLRLITSSPLSESITHPDIIVVGRDSRVSGAELSAVVIDEVQRAGFTVIDIGIVPTPTVQYTVLNKGLAGGIVLTASHNPREWNGLKFVDSDALFVTPTRTQTLIDLSVGPTESAYELKSSSPVEKFDAIQDHIDGIVKLPYIAPLVEEIRAKKYKVAFDPVCGAGGEAISRILSYYGVEVIGINLEETGEFPHTPEPIPDNLHDLSEHIRSNHVAFGVAVDPDVDRCVLADEQGNIITEELTQVIAADFLLSSGFQTPSVITNLSSSNALSTLCKRHGVPVYRSAVGEANVAAKMVSLGSRLGGEGNGGVLLADSHIGRDALVASSLTLCWYHLKQQAFSSAVSSLPQPSMCKLKADLSSYKGDLSKLLENIALEGRRNPNISLVTVQDGVRLDWSSGHWVHIRPSNTEPIVRIIAEDPQGQLFANSLANTYRKLIENYSDEAKSHADESSGNVPDLVSISF